MMYLDFQFPRKEVEKYIQTLNHTPLKNFVDYALDNIKVYKINSYDICQFSNFDNCTKRLCELMIADGDKGIHFIDAGRLLLNDGKKRSKAAYGKYGENQVKTGHALGLIYSLCNINYVSCIGYVFVTLSEVDRSKLLSRLVLRDRTVIYLLQQATKGKVIVRKALAVLSDSTYNRRKGNLRMLLSYVLDSKEDDFSTFKDNLIF